MLQEDRWPQGGFAPGQAAGAGLAGVAGGIGMIGQGGIGGMIGQREAPVYAELTALNLAVESLEKQIEAFIARIDPVCTPSGINAANLKEKQVFAANQTPQPVRSGLTRDIAMAKEKLTQLHARVSAILSRIEL